MGGIEFARGGGACDALPRERCMGCVNDRLVGGRYHAQRLVVRPPCHRSAPPCTGADYTRWKSPQVEAGLLPGTLRVSLAGEGKRMSERVIETCAITEQHWQLASGAAVAVAGRG